MEDAANVSLCTNIYATLKILEICCNPLISTKKLKRKSAFTLAEVLITLGVIGIVAALTLPNLIADYRDKVLIVQTKKTYSTIMNAIARWQAGEGVIGDNTSLFNPNQESYDTAKNFSKYFNYIKFCKSKSDSGCDKYYITYKFASKEVLNGATVGETLDYPLLILNNGAKIYIRQLESCGLSWVSCERDEKGYCKKDENGDEIMVPGGTQACGYIYFDVNGAKGPNQYGRDAYVLQIRQNEVVPESSIPGGAQSLKNILYGIDEFVYEDYNIGESVE